MMSYSFTAKIQIIGINPYVLVPEFILAEIFGHATKSKGPIPVAGTINDLPYLQTLVKYSGLWRLYINTLMLSDSPKRIGEPVRVTIQYDPSDRTVQPHPKLMEALENNTTAKLVFDRLAPSRQKEMIKYITALKTEQTRDRIIQRAVDYLLGKGTFIGKKHLNDT